MPCRVVLPLAIAWSVLGGPAVAHYHMLLPEAASARKGRSVTVGFRWGHPFEHQIFNASPPESVVLSTPTGQRSELAGALEKVAEAGPEAGDVTAYRVRVTPGERGDYVLAVRCAPVWMEEDQEFLQDAVKVVLHVQAQRGWDRPAGLGFELMPLTRPYGLPAGSVFQAQATVDGKPAAGALVEIERYNARPPRELPPNEQITRTARTDPNGVITCSLTEPGWWCVTALRDGGTRPHDGKTYPVRQRTTFWIFVDPPQERADR